MIKASGICLCCGSFIIGFGLSDDEAARYALHDHRGDHDFRGTLVATSVHPEYVSFFIMALAGAL